MKQLVKIHMLPTEDKTDIHETKHGRLYYQQASFDPVIYQHLYFTSDEKIRKDDWFIHSSHGTTTLLKAKQINLKEIIDNEGKTCWVEYSKKIVATTDKSLKTSLNTHSELHSKGIYTLPQIPQQFIEDYCKVGGIDEVLLEYEGKFCWVCKDTIVNNIHCEGHELQLKLDSNNYVTTYPIKDSWSRDEVIKLFETFELDRSRFYSEDAAEILPLEDWIKENLK